MDREIDWAYEAGRKGDELHPEPEFDVNGLPILSETEREMHEWFVSHGYNT